MKRVSFYIIKYIPKYTCNSMSINILRKGLKLVLAILSKKKSCRDILGWILFLYLKFTNISVPHCR